MAQAQTRWAFYPGFSCLASLILLGLQCSSLVPESHVTLNSNFTETFLWKFPVSEWGQGQRRGEVFIDPCLHLLRRKRKVICGHYYSSHFTSTSMNFIIRELGWMSRWSSESSISNAGSKILYDTSLASVSSLLLVANRSSTKKNCSTVHSPTQQPYEASVIILALQTGFEAQRGTPVSKLQFMLLSWQ